MMVNAGEVRNNKLKKKQWRVETLYYELLRLMDGRERVKSRTSLKGLILITVSI